MALDEKVYGVRTPFSVRILAVHGVLSSIQKAEKPLRRNQKFATSDDFS